MTPPEAQLYAEQILLCLRNQYTWEERMLAVSGELLRISWECSQNERATSHTMPEAR